jgi:hypothetical protein
LEQIADDVIGFDRGARSMSRSIEAVSGDPAAVNIRRF